MAMNVRQALNLIALLALAGVPSSNAFGVDWVTPPGPEGWFWYRDDAGAAQPQPSAGDALG